MGVEVGLLLVLLDIEAVGAPEDLPVDVANVIAGDIFPVLGKLNTEAVIRAAMESRDESLDDKPGLELQPGDPVENLGVKVLGRRISSQSSLPYSASR